MAALHNQALFTSLPQTLAGCPNDSELLVTVSRLLWWWVLWMLSAAPGRHWQEVFPTAVPTRSPAVHGCKSLCPARGPRAASAGPGTSSLLAQTRLLPRVALRALGPPPADVPQPCHRSLTASCFIKTSRGQEASNKPQILSACSWLCICEQRKLKVCVVYC